MEIAQDDCSLKNNLLALYMRTAQESLDGISKHGSRTLLPRQRRSSHSGQLAQLEFINRHCIAHPPVGGIGIRRKADLVEFQTCSRHCDPGRALLGSSTKTPVNIKCVRV